MESFVMAETFKYFYLLFAPQRPWILTKSSSTPKRTL